MPINLVGPAQGQAADLLAQQAQLAQAQQLAYAMLGQYLKPTDATIHTGGSNPFARDVVNLAPLGNVLAAAFTGNRIGGKGGLNEQQRELANQILERQRSEVENAFMGTMPSGAPSVMGTPPTMLEAAKRLLGATMPESRALGANILGQVAKGEEARQVTPGNVASLVNANVDPASITTHPGAFNYPLMGLSDINNLSLLPKQVGARPGEQGYAIPQGRANAGQPTTVTYGPHAALPPTVVPPRGVYPNSGAVNRSGVNQVASSLGGDYQPEKGAAYAAAERTGAIKPEQAQEDMERINAYQLATPTLIGMNKIAYLAAKYGNNFGAMGDVIQEVRKIAQQLGISKDDANSIVNYETFMKSAVPQAVGRLRDAVGARPSTVEFKTFLDSLGATGTTNPYALINVISERMLNNYNEYQNYKQYTMPQLQAINPDMAKAYSVRDWDIEKDVMKPMKDFGMPVNWKQNRLGHYYNSAVPAMPGGPETNQPGAFGGPNPAAYPPGITNITPVGQ